MRAKLWLSAFVLLLGLFGLFRFLVDFRAQAPSSLASLQFSSLPTAARWSVGLFRIEWIVSSPESAQLVIRHRDTSQIIWSSVPGKSFVAAGIGKEQVHESRGSFVFQERLFLRCEKQAITAFDATRNSLTLRGHLDCPKAPNNPTQAPYLLRFQTQGPKKLTFSYTIQDPRFNRTFLLYESTADERFFGFGEQFTHVEMKGRKLPIFVMEQGIGRGVEPISTAANLIAGKGVSGDWHTSYAGVPHYITSKMRSLYLANNEYSAFDMRPDEHVELCNQKSTQCVIATVEAVCEPSAFACL